MSKYGVFFGPYSPGFGLNTEDKEFISVFSPNMGVYGSEKTPYLDTFCTQCYLPLREGFKSVFRLDYFTSNEIFKLPQKKLMRTQKKI